MRGRGRGQGRGSSRLLRISEKDKQQLNQIAEEVSKCSSVNELLDRIAKPDFDRNLEIENLSLQYINWRKKWREVWGRDENVCGGDNNALSPFNDGEKSEFSEHDILLLAKHRAYEAFLAQNNGLERIISYQSHAANSLSSEDYSRFPAELLPLSSSSGKSSKTASASLKADDLLTNLNQEVDENADEDEAEKEEGSEEAEEEMAELDDTENDYCRNYFDPGDNEMSGSDDN